MRAWLLDAYDGVDKMRLVEVADPKPAAGEVVLRMFVAGLNLADYFSRRESVPGQAEVPAHPRPRWRGEVLALGERVTGSS